jgi:hypothetical protein
VTNRTSIAEGEQNEKRKIRLAGQKRTKAASQLKELRKRLWT